MVATLVSGPRAGALRDTVCRAAWLATLPAATLTLTGGDEVVRLDWLLLGVSAHLDEVARPLLALTVVLYAVALAFVPRSGARRGPVLSGFLLVCFAASVGVVAAADVVTFYLAFTVMSFTGYALVLHDRTAGARRAARIYMVMTVLGESAVLAAMALVTADGGLVLADAPAAVAASERRDLIVALLLVGFGVKAGTAPLHVWLPLAHSAAPTPASAVLSGVMVKAGLVGWLRFLPLGQDASPGWGTTFVLLALLGGFLAVVAGLLQDNPKVILAYSTISQMGFLAVLVGVALAEPGLAHACVLAAVVYAVHHGVTKASLFLGVQVWSSERVPRWTTTTVLAVAGLSLAGAPFTSGYVAKYGAKEAVGDATFPAAGGAALADVLPWFGLGSTLLLARCAVVLWRRERKGEHSAPVRDGVWAASAVVAVVPVAWLAQRLDPPQAVPGWLSPGTLWAQSWPVLLGVALALAAARLARRRELDDSPLAHPRGDVVPPGDVVAVEERAALAVGRALRRAAARLGSVTGRVRTALAATPSPLPALSAVQARLGLWEASGAVLLFLAAAGLLLALTGGSSP
ncbi:formate hydrogenlyase [Xylanimonas oleitrophica]|uniref:Formate hydrogenlyase n=2 Tax=Xylanimonas oleitrophica TaxID=2607479 RepID=A0A2W5WTC3_9MICO|nr:formate hydrogenlyase [Xylanimonas oleitrophica]